MAEVNVKDTKGKSKAVEAKPTAPRDWGLGLGSRSPWWPSMFSGSPLDLMRRFMDEIDWSMQSFRPRGLAAEETMWTPAVESFERDGQFIVRAELPGINKEDVKVEITDDGLILQGERKREHEEKGADFYRSEWSYGSFWRCVPLPVEAVNADKVHAQFDNGVLEVSMPIPESQRKRRQIAIEEPGGEKKKTAA